MPNPPTSNPLSEGERPWQADDPFDAMAESFRLQILNMVLEAKRATLYRELDPMRQVECFMAGTMVALIGICFAHIMPTGRDEMMTVIREYLPQARKNVEEMMRPDAPALSPSHRDT